MKYVFYLRRGKGCYYFKQTDSKPYTKLLGMKSGPQLGASAQAFRSSGLRIGWGAQHKCRVLGPALNQGPLFLHNPTHIRVWKSWPLGLHRTETFWTTLIGRTTDKWELLQAWFSDLGRAYPVGPRVRRGAIWGVYDRMAKQNVLDVGYRKCLKNL